MQKMTRKTRDALETALHHAIRADGFIDRPDIAVALKDRVATTTLHYTRADGATLYEIDKDIGSDLCGLKDCVALLRNIINLDDTLRRTKPRNQS
jgi:hypothetical protein